MDDMSSQVMTKKKKGGGELDDIMSEVADRGEISEADKAAQLAAFREAKIASFNPLPPGRIIPDPIPGMDGESPRRSSERLEFSLVVSSTPKVVLHSIACRALGQSQLPIPSRSAHPLP